MRIAIAAVAAMSIGGSAAAAVIDAEDMLRSFTVIALGDYELHSHTPGSVYVGGDFKASQSISGGISNATIGEANGTLIVGGNITGGGSTTINGNVAVGGIVTDGSRVNVNDGTVTEGANVPVGDVATALRDLSGRLAQLPETGATTSGDHNNPRLNLGAVGADGVAVINFGTDDLDWFFGGNPGISFMDGPLTTIINIAGDSFHLRDGSNFNDFTGSNNVIFNFYEALEIVLDSGFGASILAPNADIWVNKGGTNSFLVGNNVVQRAEIRKPFDGNLPPPSVSTVPLPAAGWMLIAGLGALVAAGRRRAA